METVFANDGLQKLGTCNLSLWWNNINYKYVKNKVLRKLFGTCRDSVSVQCTIMQYE
jgi:hypothetical protein